MAAGGRWEEGVVSVSACKGRVCIVVNKAETRIKTNARSKHVAQNNASCAATAVHHRRQHHHQQQQHKCCCCWLPTRESRSPVAADRPRLRAEDVHVRHADARLLHDLAAHLVVRWR